MQLEFLLLLPHAQFSFMINMENSTFSVYFREKSTRKVIHQFYLVILESTQKIIQYVTVSLLKTKRISDKKLVEITQNFKLILKIFTFPRGEWPLNRGSFPWTCGENEVVICIERFGESGSMAGLWGLELNVKNCIWRISFQQ